MLLRQLLFLALLGLGACAELPVLDTAGEEESQPGDVFEAPGSPDDESGSAGAVRELVQEGRASRSSGDYAHALASLERAIRIEPRNPYLWLELGEVHLAKGDPRQAAAMARRAISVAGQDEQARTAGEALLQRASRP